MKKKNRYAAAVLAAVMGISLAGCGNTRIVLTTGLGLMSCSVSGKYPAGFRRRWCI